MTARLQEVCPCGVGQAISSESGLDIASNSGPEGDRVTDLCRTARFGGQVCPLEIYPHVQKVSCDDGRLDPAQDRDLSERKRLSSAHGPADGSWLFGVGISCGRLPAFLGHCPTSEILLKYPDYSISSWFLSQPGLKARCCLLVMSLV